LHWAPGKTDADKILFENYYFSLMQLSDQYNVPLYSPNLPYVISISYKLIPTKYIISNHGKQKD